MTVFSFDRTVHPLFSETATDNGQFTVRCSVLANRFDNVRFLSNFGRATLLLAIASCSFVAKSFILNLFYALWYSNTATDNSPPQHSIPPPLLFVFLEDSLAMYAKYATAIGQLIRPMGNSSREWA